MARGIKRRLKLAQKRVRKDISGFAARGGKIATGLASEGWHGGYRQALSDIELLLNGVEPNDDRGYWRKEQSDGQ